MIPIPSTRMNKNPNPSEKNRAISNMDEFNNIPSSQFTPSSPSYIDQQGWNRTSTGDTKILSEKTG